MSTMIENEHLIRGVTSNGGEVSHDGNARAFPRGLVRPQHRLRDIGRSRRRYQQFVSFGRAVILRSFSSAIIVRNG